MEDNHKQHSINYMEGEFILLKVDYSSRDLIKAFTVEILSPFCLLFGNDFH